MDPFIRNMKKDDWDAVSRIYQEGIETNLATFETECPSYEQWDSAHVKTCSLVIESKTPVSERCVYSGVAEVSIYVSETNRGKGLGTLLLNELIKKGFTVGFWTLQSGIMQNY